MLLHLRTSCGIACLTVAGIALAASESNPFSTPKPPDVTAVAPAKTFISMPPGGGLKVGETITLAVKNSASREAASVKQVRLFRLSSAIDIPVPHDYFGDCDVFLTTVISVQPVSDRGVHALQFDGLSRPFLEVNGPKTSMGDARWMAVFETSTLEPGDVFRIRSSDKSKYFEGGWTFTLLADKKSYTAAEIAEAVAEQLPGDQLLKELRIRDKSRPCHLVTITRVASGESRPELLACAITGDEALGL